MAAEAAPTKPPAVATPATVKEAVPTESPLRAADARTRQQAVAEAWTTFQRSCRPCHGNLGAGDGPYAASSARPAADLRRPSRDMAQDAVRFTRIRDGAASLPERAWESNMPAFGDDLSAAQIWGLVALLEDFGKEASGVDPSATGADVYASRCAVCHGAEGKGDGPLASELMPLPRNLTKSDYRFRSTEYGAAPLDTDIIGTVSRGLEGTSMGRFLPLGGIRLEDVAAHVQTLAPELFATKPAPLAGSPIPAEPVAQMAARGRAVYEEARCWECHGKEGRGNGPSAATLKDDTERPSIATDLTKRWHMKAGGGAPSIFRLLTGGMNGTPMASYASTLSAEDRWAVAHYVERLGKPRARFSPSIQAEISSEPLPLDPAAALWKAIPATSVALGPQMEVPPYWTQPSVDAVAVAVAVNRDQIGFLLVWNDRTRDVRNDDAGSTSTVAATLARYGTWRLPDQVAVQFAEKVDPKIALPSPYLGDADRSVIRWIWSADRQERGEPAMSERATGARSTPVSLTAEAPVQTAATYVDGQWRVVLLGKRPPKGGASTAIALQAWDGAIGESGRWHSLSGWISVNLR
jgi:DMSO reductase family type II enzyme heme b subunit